MENTTLLVLVFFSTIIVIGTVKIVKSTISLLRYENSRCVSDADYHGIQPAFCNNLDCEHSCSNCIYFSNPNRCRKFGKSTNSDDVYPCFKCRYATNRSIANSENEIQPSTGNILTRFRVPRINLIPAIMSIKCPYCLQSISASDVYIECTVCHSRTHVDCWNSSDGKCPVLHN